MLKKGLLVALAALVVDQLHKNLMLHYFGFASGRMVEVTSFFNLVMVWNHGISFGILNNGTDDNALTLIIMALAIVSFLLFWLKKAENKYQATAIGLIIGGALGNVIDRAIYGAVADFFDFYIGTYHWPAFNIADSTIFIGVFLLVIESFIGIKKKS
jgi:signal peptidase II